MNTDQNLCLIRARQCLSVSLSTLSTGFKTTNLESESETQFNDEPEGVGVRHPTTNNSASIQRDAEAPSLQS